MNEAPHPFESRGLGRAPFRYTGCSSSFGPLTVEVNGVEVRVGAPGQAMGCCAYCGRGIGYLFHVQDADGRESVVGSECVNRVGGYALRAAISADDARLRREAELRRFVERKRRARRALGDDAVIAHLSGREHPNPSQSRRGGTLLSAALWYLKHAGRKGQTRACRWVEQSADAVGWVDAS